MWLVLALGGVGGRARAWHSEPGATTDPAGRRHRPPACAAPLDPPLGVRACDGCRVSALARRLRSTAGARNDLLAHRDCDGLGSAPRSETRAGLWHPPRPGWADRPDP